MKAVPLTVIFHTMWAGNICCSPTKGKGYRALTTTELRGMGASMILLPAVTEVIYRFSLQITLQ